MAERHREAVAGRGAVPELLLAGALRRRAIGKLLLAGAPWRSAIGKILLAGSAMTELLLAGALRRRAIGKLLLAGAPWRSAIGKMLMAGAQWRRAVGKLLLAGVPCGKTMRQHRKAAAEGYHLRSLLWYSAHSLGRKRHREISCGVSGSCESSLANIVRISSRVVEIILLGSSR